MTTPSEPASQAPHEPAQAADQAAEPEPSPPVAPEGKQSTKRRSTRTRPRPTLKEAKRAVSDEAAEAGDSQRDHPLPAGPFGANNLLSALVGFGFRLELSQVERIITIWQTEWQARAQQDQVNQKLILEAERQKSELTLKQRELDLEIAKARAEQDRLRKRVDLEIAKARAEQRRLQEELNQQQRFHVLEARRESIGDLIRSVVLFLVVLAVVLTPVAAMGLFNVQPEEFSQYVAPITGIAGTVLGYWFGRQEPKR